MMSEDDLYHKMEQMRKKNRLPVQHSNRKLHRLVKCFVAVIMFLLVSFSLISVLR